MSHGYLCLVPSNRAITIITWNDDTVPIVTEDYRCGNSNAGDFSWCIFCFITRLHHWIWGVELSNPTRIPRAMSTWEDLVCSRCLGGLSGCPAAAAAACWWMLTSKCTCRVRWEHEVAARFSWARFLSLTRGKLRLCWANHRAGYFRNLACDWLSIVWAYSEQETENGPWLSWLLCTALSSSRVSSAMYPTASSSGATGTCTRPPTSSVFSLPVLDVLTLIFFTFS